MFNYIYPATLSTDEDGRILVEFPDVHGAVTDGANKDEALNEAYDCLAESIAAAMANGEEVPAPSRPKRGQIEVILMPDVAMKAALYTTMHELGYSNQQLAKQMEVNEKEIRRMLDPYHATKLPRMLEALRALGKNVMVSLRDHAA